MRFRLLRKMPSHEKLYLLASDSSYRVITGSANLSLAALSGRHKEVFIVFDGETAYRAFEGILLARRGRSCGGAGRLLDRARRQWRSSSAAHGADSDQRSALRSDVVDRSRDCRGSAQSAIGRIDRRGSQSCERLRCAASWAGVEYRQRRQDGYHGDLVLSCIQSAQDRAGRRDE